MSNYTRKTLDIFISDKFRLFLEQFKNVSPIAKIILYKRIPVDLLAEDNVNYISISESDPTKISYLTSDRITKIESSETDDYWTSSQRFRCKPGSFVTKILKNVPPKEIEKFVTLFKSFSNREEFTFEVVSGKKIIDFYNHENYASQRGSLGSSCMKYNKCGEYLDLYTENDSISMLIIKNPSQHIIGRAILWNFTDHNSGKDYKIMDRIYSVHDEEWVFIFKKWATENGYLYKSKQNWANSLQFENDTTPSKEIKLSIKLKSFNHTFYPYLDTFKWLDSKEGVIYNYLPDHFNLESSETYKLLILADGRVEKSKYLGFDDIDRDWGYRADLVYLVDSGLWTSIENCNWSKNLDRYLLRKESRWDGFHHDYFRIPTAELQKEIAKSNEQMDIEWISDIFTQ